MEYKPQVYIGVEELKAAIRIRLAREVARIAAGTYVDELHSAKARAKQDLIKDIIAAIAEIPAKDSPPPARYSTNIVQGILQIIDDKLAENADLQNRYPEAGQTLVAEMWAMRGLRDQIQKLLDDAAPTEAAGQCAPLPRFVIAKEGPWYVATDTVGGKYLRYFECRACAAAYCDRLNAGSPE